MAIHFLRTCTLLLDNSFSNGHISVLELDVASVLLEAGNFLLVLSDGTLQADGSLDDLNCCCAAGASSNTKDEAGLVLSALETEGANSTMLFTFPLMCVLLIRATLADLAKGCNTGADDGNTSDVENVSTLLMVAIGLEDLVDFCMTCVLVSTGLLLV
jgi:hypothetical protein